MENIYSTHEDVNNDELDFHTLVPGMGTNGLLGLRAAPRASIDVFEQFKIRLQIMLDAFSSGKLRKAQYQADLVACWSTMCNIQYSYSKNDTVANALVKVIRKLRGLGVRIYNFNAESVGSEIDFRFFSYAAAHTQANATNRTELPGTPIFTGRADTVTHFLNGAMLLKHLSPEISVGECEQIAVRLVNMSIVMNATALSDFAGIQENLQMATSGTADGACFHDCTVCIVGALKQIPTEQLSAKRLVTVAIFTKTTRLFAWALCPASIELNTLCVGREELNGTLVLATLGSAPLSATVVAFLTVSDHQSGTFLLPTDNDGNIDLVFKTPRRRDIVASQLLPDRRLQARVFLYKDAIAPAPEAESLITQSNFQVVEEVRSYKEHGITQLKKLIQKLDDPVKVGLLDIDIGHPELEARARASSQMLRIDPTTVLRGSLRLHEDGQSIETDPAGLAAAAASRRSR